MCVGLDMERLFTEKRIWCLIVQQQLRDVSLSPQPFDSHQLLIIWVAICDHVHISFLPDTLHGRNPSGCLQGHCTAVLSVV
mmetsp:Transcript_14335/g.25941  ORF Transcript_14335/g.25941 Transcript_14335/m.25941 type:complete len:81 (-) Transcript_14335:11-253(-)